jgi:hypothetical protein
MSRLYVAAREDVTSLYVRVRILMAIRLVVLTAMKIN